MSFTIEKGIPIPRGRLYGKRAEARKLLEALTPEHDAVTTIRQATLLDEAKRAGIQITTRSIGRATGQIRVWLVEPKRARKEK